MRILDKPGLTFDDVLLVPAKGYVNSRHPDSVDIDIGVQLTPRTFKMKYPIISANMDTITGKEMADEMNRLGGLGIVHRFMSFEDHVAALGARGNSGVTICIGAVEQERERLLYLKQKTFVSAVLIDTAHGHSQMMVKQIEWVRQTHPDIDIIAGNVCTADAALALIRAGATCVKVGVGPGSMCTTRIHTGNGVPQLSAIMDVRRGIEKVYAQQRGEKWRPRVIADGGIRNAGDIVKALAAGADAIMSGSLFAGTNETPTLPGKHDDLYAGPPRKRYRGMASREFQEDWKGEAHSVEGESTIVPSKGPVAQVFQELVERILSGMSYQVAYTLDDLYVNAEFILQSPAGYVEANPHVLNK
jgi:IMP dehydrogenase